MSEDQASLLLDQISGTHALVGPPLVYRDNQVEVLVAAGTPGTAGELHGIVLGDFLDEMPEWTAHCASVITIRRPNDITISEAGAVRREIVWWLRKRIRIEVFDTDLALARAYADRFPSAKSRQVLNDITRELAA